MRSLFSEMLEHPIATVIIVACFRTVIIEVAEIVVSGKVSK